MLRLASNPHLVDHLARANRRTFDHQSRMVSDIISELEDQAALWGMAGLRSITSFTAKLGRSLGRHLVLV